MSEPKRVREMEELIGLQAQAIQALQQAAQALQIALQALERAMADKGEQQKIVFVPQPFPAPSPSPYNPMIGGTWNGTLISEGIPYSGVVSTITNTSKSFGELVMSGGMNV